MHNDALDRLTDYPFDRLRALLGDIDYYFTGRGVQGAVRTESTGFRRQYYGEVSEVEISFHDGG